MALKTVSSLAFDPLSGVLHNWSMAFDILILRRAENLGQAELYSFG